MELLLHVLAEGTLFIGLAQTSVVRELVKEVLIESYVHGLAIDLHAGDVAFDRDDLGAILVFFSEFAERVLATDVSDNSVGGKSVADIQAFDDHLHVGFVHIATVGRHAGDPRVSSLEGNDVLVAVVGLFGFGETAGGGEGRHGLGWDEVLEGLCDHSTDGEAVGVIQESSWGFEALHL